MKEQNQMTLEDAQQTLTNIRAILAAKGYQQATAKLYIFANDKPLGVICRKDEPDKFFYDKTAEETVRSMEIWTQALLPQPTDQDYAPWFQLDQKQLADMKELDALLRSN